MKPSLLLLCVLLPRRQLLQRLQLLLQPRQAGHCSGTVIRASSSSSSTLNHRFASILQLLLFA